MIENYDEIEMFPITTLNNAEDKTTTLDELISSLYNSLTPPEAKGLSKLYKKVKRALKANEEDSQRELLLKLKSTLLFFIDIHHPKKTDSIMKLMNYINDYLATHIQRENRLLGLPDEILIYIFSLLDRDQQWVLAVACQRLYFISQDSTLMNIKYPRLNYSVRPTLAKITFQDTHPTCLTILSNREIMIGCDNGVIYIWDIVENKHKLTLQGHTARINCFLILPDNRIVSAAKDHTLRIWDRCQRQSLLQLVGHEDAVTHVVSAEENMILSGSKDCRIMLWNTNTGECIRSLISLLTPVKGLAFVSPNIVVCGSYAFQMAILDINTGQRLQGRRMPGHRNSLGIVGVI